MQRPFGPGFMGCVPMRTLYRGKLKYAGRGVEAMPGSEDPANTAYEDRNLDIAPTIRDIRWDQEYSRLNGKPTERDPAYS